MKKKKNYILSILLFILLFVITFYFIFANYSFSELKSVMVHCNPYYISVAIGCVFLYLFFGSIFLKKAFSSFGIPISFWQALCYSGIEIYFSAVTPSSTGGQPVQAFYMARDHIPYQKSTIVILINTILYKLAIMLLGIVAILMIPNLIFQNGWLFLFLMILGMTLNILVIVFFTCIIYSHKLPRQILKMGIRLLLFFHLIKKEDQPKREENMEKALQDYHECANFTKNHPSLLIKSFLYILLQRISLFSISYFIYRAFGLNEYTFSTIFFLQVAITLAIDSVPSPGGVMVGEGLTYQVNLFIYGATFAISSMLLLRGISFYLLVLISSLLFVIHHFVGGLKNDRNL